MRDDRIGVADDHILITNFKEVEVAPSDFENQFLEQPLSIYIGFLSTNDTLANGLSRSEDLVDPGAHVLMRI